MPTREIIKTLCEKKGISIQKLEKELDFSNGSIAKSGDNLKSERLLAVARYFGVSMEYLMGCENNNSDIPYYLNDDAREMAEFMFENPEYKVLFDASRKINKDDIGTVKAIMDKFRNIDID